jgi:hypothetical protein
MREQISTARLWRPAECALCGNPSLASAAKLQRTQTYFFSIAPFFFITSFFDVYQGAHQAVNIMESEK